MKNKNDFKKDNAIIINSYNYEEFNGFSQETAVETQHSKTKTHKFILEINNDLYDMRFENYHCKERYAAMEDEWVEMETVIADMDSLTIENLSFDFGEPDTFKGEQVTDEMKEFVKVLIQKAEENGIGCTHTDHMNMEDDYGRTYKNRSNTGFANAFSDLLFIKDHEQVDFEKYLTITDSKETNDFLKEYEQKTNKKIEGLFEELESTLYEISNKSLETLEKDLEQLKKEEKEELDSNPEDLEYEIGEKYHYFISQVQDEMEARKRFDNTEEELLKHVSKSIIKNRVFGADPDELIDNEDDFFYPPIAAPKNPETVSDRFKGLKDFINSQIDGVFAPVSLQKMLGVKNELIDFLNEKKLEKENIDKPKKSRKFKFL